MIGIKNKFWRFTLALVLTVLTIIIFKILFDSLTLPDVKAPATGFLSSITETFKGIQFPEVKSPPDVSSYAQDLFAPISVKSPIDIEAKQVTPPTPAEPKPSVTTPSPKATPSSTPGGISPEGFPTAPSPEITQPTTPSSAPAPSWISRTTEGLPWVKILIAIGILILIAGGFFVRRRLKKRKKKEPMKVEEIIGHIDKLKAEKKRAIDEINATNKEKKAILEAGDVEQAIFEEFSKSPPNLYTDPAIDDIRSEHDLFERFVKLERTLNKYLVELREIERDFLIIFKLCKQHKNTSQHEEEYNNLMYTSIVVDEIRRIDRATINDLRKIGIIHLIFICFDALKHEEILAKEIEALLEIKYIGELVKGKYKKEIEDTRKLSYYHKIENLIIKALTEKIEKQIALLGRLAEQLIRKTRGAGVGGEESAESRSIVSFFDSLFTMLRSEPLPFDEVNKHLVQGEGQNILNVDQGNELSVYAQLLIDFNWTELDYFLQNDSVIEHFESFKPRLRILLELTKIAEEKHRIASERAKSRAGEGGTRGRAQPGAGAEDREATDGAEPVQPSAELRQKQQQWEEIKSRYVRNHSVSINEFAHFLREISSSGCVGGSENFFLLIHDILQPILETLNAHPSIRQRFLEMASANKEKRERLQTQREYGISILSYRLLAKIFHPDRVGDKHLQQLYTRIFAKLQEYFRNESITIDNLKDGIADCFR
ncbi:MAG: hypothetical protein AABX33_05180 [Nanoarchaeota archaeon]